MKWTCSLCKGDLRELEDGKFKCESCRAVFTRDEVRRDWSAKRSTSINQNQQELLEDRLNEGVDVYEKNKNGSMEIICSFGSVGAAGSGLLIDRSGYAVTNTHVVTHDCKPCRNIIVRIAGEQVKAEVIALGDDKGGHGRGVDLALIKLARVPEKATVVELGNFDEVRIGEQVFVIGNSLGDGNCITSGIVSDKQRVVGGHTLMMTDCAINGGNSGGPIFNAWGVAIGVIVASRIHSDGSATEGMNYAIPMNIVKDFLRAAHPQGEKFTDLNSMSATRSAQTSGASGSKKK